MNREKNTSKKTRRMYQIITTAFALFCVLMGFLCYKYYIRLQDTVKTESSGYMQEISKQIGTNVSKTINDNFSVLGTIASVIKNSNVVSFEQLQSVVREQQNLWEYQKIMLIDNNGVAYDNRGNAVVLNSDEYLQDAIVGKKPSMSASQTIDGQDCIVFAIPLQNVKINNINMFALAASYDLSTFDKILSMTAFDGKGYAHIIGEDGNVVVRSSSPNAMQYGYNILNSLSGAKIDGGKSLDEIKLDIASGASGQTEFTFNGTHEYMTYTPLGTQEWSILTFVPVSVVNAKSDILLRITLLVCGFITILFSLLLAVLMLTFVRNKRKLERIAYVDSVTGGNTIGRFYGLAQEMLSDSGKPQYAIVYINIAKFKVLNEQFGRNACDEILQSVENGIGTDLKDNECMGHLFADNFCVLVEYDSEEAIAVRFDGWYKDCAEYMEANGSSWLPLIIEFGVYVIDNDSIPFPHMIDRAKLSLTETTSELRGKLRYGIYDEHVRHMLLREKQLEDMMEEALENHEFQVYLQPKYHTQTEKIGGAEALVRWVSTSEGMIYPDEFIPLFEKNSFVIQLDFFVFEEVCKTICRWIAEGFDPVKVSVNCSRVHLKNTNFLKRYSAIADKYQLPHNLLEIELTETTVFGDVEHLSEIIMEIHNAGFGCSMDDFGSGYSSLNLIQDIPVDTLKLDKIFFRKGSRDLHRSESVIGSIITMSKALCLVTVAEGVEEQVQVDMLKRLECDYIQGYFFAKPMPIALFEQIAFHKAKEDFTIEVKDGVKK